MSVFFVHFIAHCPGTSDRQVGIVLVVVVGWTFGSVQEEVDRACSAQKSATFSFVLCMFPCIFPFRFLCVKITDRCAAVGEGPLFADPIVSAGEPFCKRV